MDDKESSENKLNFKLKDIVEIIEQHKILSIIGATAYGYFYLFVYTTKIGIPFTIDNPNISMLVIAIAVGVFLIFGLLIGVILLPAFITGNEFDPFYSQTNKMLFNFRIYFILIGWSVIFAFSAPLVVIHLESLIPKRISLLGCLALFILCSFMSCQYKRNKPKKIEKTSSYYSFLFNLCLL